MRARAALARHSRARSQRPATMIAGPGRGKRTSTGSNQGGASPDQGRAAHVGRNKRSALRRMRSENRVKLGNLQYLFNIPSLPQVVAKTNWPGKLTLNLDQSNEAAQ